MAVYGKALTYIREIHDSLNNELGDIDLAVLRNETMSSKTWDGALLPDDLARKWARVIETLSVSVTGLGKEIELVDRYVARRQQSTMVMFNGVCAMAILLAVITAVSAVASINFKGFIQIIIAEGIHLVSLLSFFAIASVWTIVLKNRYERTKAANSGPVMDALRKFKTNVCDRSIMNFAESLRTGRIPEETTTAIEQFSRACAASDELSSRCGDGGKVKLCADTLETALKPYCNKALAIICDALSEVKNDVNRFDRPYLWRCVSSGMDDTIRKFISLLDDDASSSGGLEVSASTINAILDNDVLPFLMLPCMEHDAFDYEAYLDFPEFQEDVVESKDMCWRRCMDDPECAVASYRAPRSNEKAGRCAYATDMAAALKDMKYIGSDAARKPSNKKSEFRFIVRRNQPGQDHDQNVFVCGTVQADIVGSKLSPIQYKKQNDRDDVGAWCASNDTCDVASDDAAWMLNPGETFDSLLSDSEGSMYCVKTTPEDLYLVGAARNAARMLQDQAPLIANNLLVVLRRYKYRITLSDFRPYIDAKLSRFYGSEVYNTSVSPVIDDILVRVKKLVKESPLKTKYIDPVRLCQKTAALTSSEWLQMDKNIKQTIACTKTHRDMFVPFHDTSMVETLRILTFYAFFIIVIGYVMYTVITAHNVIMGDIPLPIMVRRLLIALSVLTMFLVILETSCKKFAIRDAHNADKITMNGELMLNNLQNSSNFLTSLRNAFEERYDDDKNKKPTQSDMVLAAAALRYMKQAIDKFDRCNFINTSVAKMPFPVTELTVYAVVALVFLAAGGAVIAQIDMHDKINNIRILKQTRARVLRGDIRNMEEVTRTVQCCMPGDMVWDMTIWFGVLLICLLSVWFVYITSSAADDYESALTANDDCA